MKTSRNFSSIPFHRHPLFLSLGVVSFTKTKIPGLMEESEWVLVKQPTDRDLWCPSGLLSSDLGSGDPLEIRFNEPAKYWTDALPIGNGRLGAMVWGGVPNEILNLNEDTLWNGSPEDYTDREAPKAISEVRNLVNDDQYAAATEAALKLSGNPTADYQLLGDIKIDFENSHAAFDKETYSRVLDLDSATVKVRYSVDGVEFTREYFASNPDQVIAVKISGNKPGSLTFTVSLDSQLQHKSYAMGTNQIVMSGNCTGNDTEVIHFSSVLDLHIGGRLGELTFLDGNRLHVVGCDWAVMYFVASSSFDGPFTKPSKSRRDPGSEVLKMLRSLQKFQYAELYDRHKVDYQNLFHRMSIQLSRSSIDIAGNGTIVTDPCLNNIQEKNVQTSKRVKSFVTDEDPKLVELLFQYGRYLLIACSRPGTQVANLQGIWNKELEPRWSGAPHLNINLQMNYWPSLPCNLDECQEPLFEYISLLSVNGSKTAKVNYEANGWVAHHVSDIWVKTSPGSGEAKWALWPMGGAWLCTHLWEHYTYTNDTQFLRDRAYPILKSCSSFLLDWLLEGHGEFLETNPSTSPEHLFTAPDGNPASVSYSTTMDMAIIREIFSAMLSAAEVLGTTEDELIGRVREALQRLPPTKIARDGSIMEWAQDFKDPEPDHRHLSHLFGLFPGHTVTIETTPDLCKAAEYSLFKRGEDGPGWSTTWKTALWARLRDSQQAYHMVKHLFYLVDPDREIEFEGGLYSNLFAAHPPFQIDANFGFSAAIAEMIVQSTMKDLYLLPALPRDKWPSGCVKGLKARGNVTVSICWSGGELHEVGVWTRNPNTITRLHYQGITITSKLSSGIVYTFDKLLKCSNSYPLF